MRLFPYQSIRMTCPSWRKAPTLIEQRIPRPLMFQWQDDRRIVVGTNTGDLDELWHIAPTECVNDIRGRIYMMAKYLHHAIDLDSIRNRFIDRPGHTAVLDAMNKALRERDQYREDIGLATFDELIRHALGIKETLKPLNLLVEA